jgi:transcriptional regulator with XRE-family HTH domain
MDNTYERKNRIEQALNIRNMKQVELVEKTGLSKGSINHWIKQRYQPKQNAIMKMAKALEVSEMWLAGYDVPMERPAAQIKNDELVQLIYEIKENEDLKDLFSDICSLSGDQRNTIKSMVNELSKVNSLQ